MSTTSNGRNSNRDRGGSVTERKITHNAVSKLLSNSKISVNSNPSTPVQPRPLLRANSALVTSNGTINSTNKGNKLNNKEPTLGSLTPGRLRPRASKFAVTNASNNGNEEAQYNGNGTTPSLPDDGGLLLMNRFLESQPHGHGANNTVQDNNQHERSPKTDRDGETTAIINTDDNSSVFGVVKGCPEDSDFLGLRINKGTNTPELESNPMNWVQPQFQCGPNCRGLHFCLQSLTNLNSLQPMSLPANCAPSNNYSAIQNGNGPTHKENGLFEECYSPPPTEPKPKSNMTLQDAFSALMAIRVLAHDSGVSSLEELQNLAGVEAMLLKIFSVKKTGKV